MTITSNLFMPARLKPHATFGYERCRFRESAVTPPLAEDHSRLPHSVLGGCREAATLRSSQRVSRAPVPATLQTRPRPAPSGVLHPRRTFMLSLTVRGAGRTPAQEEGSHRDRPRRRQAPHCRTSGVTTLSAVLVCVMLGALAVFQTFLAFGAPLGRFAWVGSIGSCQPRCASVVQCRSRSTRFWRPLSSSAPTW